MKIIDAGIWDNLGKPSATVPAKSLAVGTNSDGRLELLATATDGNLWHNWQQSPNGSYAGWAAFASTGQVLQAVAATRDTQGRIVVFAWAQAGTIYMLSQPANWAWNSWVALGSPSGGATNQIAAGQNPDPLGQGE